MSATASESLSPLNEPQAAARRKRLADLVLMVAKMMGKRLPFSLTTEFDGVESAELIAALRACSFYVDHIGCVKFGDLFAIQVKGIDGHDYNIEFSLFGPGFSVHTARVRVTELQGVGEDGQVDSSSTTMDVLEEYSKRLKLGRVTTDLAFLIGMSLVIGFMDDQDDDPDEDARLAPLLAQIMPNAEELREIRAKLPPSSINYDEEGDQPS